MKKLRIFKFQWLIAGASVLIGFWLIAHGCADSKPKIARLTLIITGYTQGYIENCGCSSGQYGGELRKARVVKEEYKEAKKSRAADKGLPVGVTLIDIGSFANYDNTLMRIQSEGVVESLSLLDYDSVGIGYNELEYPQAELWDLLKDADLPLCAANLSFVKPQNGDDLSAELNALIEPYRIVELAGGFRLGIIHVIDTKVADKLEPGSGVELTDAAGAASVILAEHKQEADEWILCIADSRWGGTDPLTVAQLTDLLQVIGFGGNNPLEAEHSTEALYPVFTKPPYMKAKTVVRSEIHFREGAQQPLIVSQQKGIQSTYKEDENVKQIIEALQPRLEQEENRIYELKQSSPQKHPIYVGHEACATCHSLITEQLLKTPHSGAYDSLKAKNRHKNGKCLECHVVGRNEPGGWNILYNPPEMRGVHCENCHGPGEYHVMLFSGEPKPEDLLAEGRNALGLQPATSEGCTTCHDEENSVGFSFGTFWPKVQHGDGLEPEPGHPERKPTSDGDPGSN